MLDAILEWYFDEDNDETKPYIVRLLRLFALYPIVLLFSFVFLFFVFLYRIVNTYILKRDVSESMGSITFVMMHVTMQPKL